MIAVSSVQAAQTVDYTSKNNEYLFVPSVHCVNSGSRQQHDCMLLQKKARHIHQGCSRRGTNDMQLQHHNFSTKRKHANKLLLLTPNGVLLVEYLYPLLCNSTPVEKQPLFNNPG